MLGTDLSQWTPRERPSAKTHNGKFVRLEKLDPARHGDDLWVALQGPGADPKQWDFMLDGPYPDRHLFNQYLQNKADSKDPFAFAVVNVSNGKAEGLLCFMEIAHTTGSIEIGYVTFGACMQRSPKSTEALYLLMKEAFDLGYRRLEWTCYSANERSKQAALRFGFSYEGTLRQRYVHKGGRNRDDCYLAILDYEWPAINRAFEKWFSDENLSASGQVRKLSELILEERGPARSVANFPTPVTDPVPNWKPAQWPSVAALEGHYVRLETLDPPKHGEHLWSALNGPDADPNMWEFIPYGPFETRSSFDEYLKGRTGREDSVLFAVIDKKSGVAEGLLGLLYIFAKHGRLVIGHATYGNGMRRSPKGTEAVYLLLKEAFSTGYRRVEWRCNNENERSKQAAERLGFTLEVVHLQHMVIKGKNRDSAMYSIIDKEWPAISSAYEKWLASENQAANGQKASLSELIAVGKQSEPTAYDPKSTF